MKLFTKNSLMKKIIISILIVLVIIFSVPRATYASWSLGGTLLKEILQLVASVGDVAMGLLNNVMLGAEGVGSAMIPRDDPNLSNKDSWLYFGKYSEHSKGDFDKIFNAGEEGEGKIDTAAFWGTKFEIPNMLYSPENIFANKIAALDVNFLRQNQYQAITDSERAKDKAKSAAGELRKTIASWYKSFRNIAIVGLLSVLIYIGIRILISSTASDKAKYKENLKDWFMALCLVFIIHFIMSGILMLTDKVTEVFSTATKDITVGVKEQDIGFKTNLTGLVRFRAQSDDAEEVTAYTLVYVVLVFYTFRFTIIYLKRFLYMAFFTMIAPLVALTYPIDKMGDGKAQAFNIWFKEYTMNAIIQPVHLILFTVFVSSAMELATDNILYAVVAIAFLIPAEKFIKKMFRLDQASSPSGLGSFAGGALAMKGLQSLASAVEGKNNGKSSSSNSQSTDNKKPKIKMQERSTLGSFGGGNNESSEDNDSGNQGNVGNDSQNAPIEADEQQNEDTSDVRNNNIFAGQEEMDRLGEELDQYDNNDLYMNPEIAEKQRRYQELSAERNQWEEEKAQQEAQQEQERIRLEEQRRLEREQAAEQENRPFESGTNSSGYDSQHSSANIMDNKQEMPGWKKNLAKKIGGKAFATTMKGTYKLAKAGVKASAALAGATIATGAALSQGKSVGETLQYAVTGAAIGKKMGNVVNRLPDNPHPIRAVQNARDKISNKVQGVKSFVNEERYGIGYAKQQEAMANNAVAKRQFMRDKDEENKYKEMAGRIYQTTGKNYSAKELMNASFDYQQAGITDEKEIEKGLALEAKHGGVNGANHDKMIDVIDFSTKYNRDSFTDSKKLAGLEGDVQSRVSGEKNQLEVMNLLAEKNGVSDYYKKVGTIGKPNKQPTSGQPQGSQNGPTRGGQPQGSQNGSTRGGQPQGSQNGPTRGGQPQGPQNAPTGGNQPQGSQNRPKRGRGRPRKSQ